MRIDEIDGTNKDALIETLAEIEHEQWMEWAKSLQENEDLSEDRINRWEKLYIPYDELTDESKEDDRVYARKVIEAIKNFTGEKE